MRVEESVPAWRKWAAPLFVAAVPALALYLWAAPWPDTPDGLFHLHRVRALAEALRMGALYPRWFPDFAFGYGYPVLNFYAPAFYYPPALLHLIGLDLIVAVRVTLAAGYALSGLAMYALLRRYLSGWPAFLGATLYLAYPYRLYDLFVRGALPEFAAFLWPPLIACAAARCLAPARSSADASSGSFVHRTLGGSAPMLLAALAWAGLILTHNLTALMMALAGLGVLAAWAAIVVLRGPRAGRGRALLAAFFGGVSPLFLGAALSAAYVLPALAEAGWVGLSAGGEVRGYAAHFTSLQTLFDPALIYRYPDAAQPVVPAPGFAALLLIAAALVIWLPQARGRRAGLGISAALTAGALWLTTASSAFVWDALAPALGKLQFPWRWQTVAALGLACTLAWLLDIGFARLTPRAEFPPGPLRTTSWIARAFAPAAGARNQRRFLAGSLALALAGFLAAYAFAGLRFTPASFAAAGLAPAQMWDFDAQHGQVGASWAGEFLPRWVAEQRWAIGREPAEPGEPARAQPVGEVRALAHGYLGERLAYDAPAPAQLVYHAFYYPAWRVEVDGRAVATRAVGGLGLLAVDLPAGQHEVVRRWAATPAVWAGRALSAAAWLAVLALLVLRRDRWRLLWAGLWLAVALLAFAAGGGWLARVQEALPIGANFGSVRLESASAGSARAGQDAPVMLHWSVIAAPEPLTAFVHVIAPDGRVVAGHDAPLAGAYTPPGRWQVGELLPDPHRIALPAGLPAGVYQLKAGLYRPGMADAPLAPVGHGSVDPRIAIGSLEVRP